MRNTIGTWKSPKSLENIAERIEHSLLNEEAAQRVYESVIVKNGTVPQYVSPLGHDIEGTRVGRLIHEKTNRPNRTWDQRGQDTIEEANQLEAEDEKRQRDRQKGWKSREEEMEKIADRLSIL